MELNEDELVHIRRGALLHDIGKMGIPDTILLKPGSFTAEEREIMQKHPVYARELFSSIAFLRPALEYHASTTKNGTVPAIPRDYAESGFPSRRGSSRW